MTDTNKKLAWILAAIVLVCAIGAIIALSQAKPAITKTATVTLRVKPAPDFTLKVEPMLIDSPLGRSVAYNATVTSVNNFAGEIVFSVSGLPAGFTAAMWPSNKLTLGPDAPKSIQINIDIGTAPTLVGDYTVTVTAESTNYN